MLTIGTGVGGGVVLDGELGRGGFGMGGGGGYPGAGGGFGASSSMG